MSEPERTGQFDGVPFWHRTMPWPERPRPPLPARVDLAIVGAGYTGLWSALACREREPDCSVVVLEASRVGHGASGRNAGWLEPSLTHGIANGERHFPREIAELERLARENLAAITRTMAAEGIACDYEPTGMLDVAVREHQIAEARETVSRYERYGWPAEFLDREAIRARLGSPRLLAAARAPENGGLLNPFKFVHGLADAVQRQGIPIAEHTPVRALRPAPGGVDVVTDDATIRAAHVIVAADGGARALLPEIRWRVTPVYDFVMISAPLTEGQRALLPWPGREGMSDLSYEFQLCRLTADNRLWWGGSEAEYHFGGRTAEKWERKPATWTKLQRGFAEFLPQLADLAWPYRWSGVIPVTTRLTPVFGTAHDGRTAYVYGFTGLGVAASRFAAQVLADRHFRPDSRLLELDYVRRPPLPFPPEPFRYAGVELTRRAMRRADESGEPGRWLRLLDRLGMGFSS